MFLPHLNVAFVSTAFINPNCRGLSKRHAPCVRASAAPGGIMMRLESVESTASAVARTHTHMASGELDATDTGEPTRASPALHADGRQADSQPAHTKDVFSRMQSPTGQDEVDGHGKKQPSGMWKKLKTGISLRSWGTLKANLHTADASPVHPFSDADERGYRTGYGAHNRTFLMRPRAGGSMGQSFRGSLRALGFSSEVNDGLVVQELIGEGTCGLVYRAQFGGKVVAAKILKTTEQYEEEGTCPVDARESFERCARAETRARRSAAAPYSLLVFALSTSLAFLQLCVLEQGSQGFGTLCSPKGGGPLGQQGQVPWAPSYDRGADEMHSRRLF